MNAALSGVRDDLYNFFFDQGDFAETGYVIAAVSGGSDSLAMLFLLRDYLVRAGRRQRLVVVTVDHGLRAGSAQEARDVARLCAEYGITHETLVWRGEKPVSAISHQARLARYDLLCDAAEKYGAGVIVTGHTLDDQAETYVMRLQRAGGRGLAAMPRLSLLRQKFCLLRPLLDVRRLALRRYLAGLGIAWIDDPSNANPQYERVRVRKCLDEEAVLHARHAVAAAAQRRRVEMEAVAALALKGRMRLYGERLCLDLTPSDRGDMPALTTLAAIGAAIMGGVQYPATGRRKLAEFIMEEWGPLPRRMTLSGAVVERTEKYLRIWREKRNLVSSVLMPGQTMIWDGRYRVINSSDETVILRPPTPTELRQVMNNMLPHWDAVRDLHIPSLETTCMICDRNGFDLPVLTSNISRNKGIGFQRIMLPFNLLVSGHDLAMFEVFQTVFAMRARKMIKSIRNFHDLENPALATVRSEHIHENLTGAPASFG